MFAEILAQIFHYQRKISATWSWRKTQIEFAGVFQIHLKPFQFFELFDAALYLYRFGRFVPETLNKLLGILNHFLLILVGTYLLLVPFLAQLYEPAVIDVVIVYPAECDFYRPSAYIIDKCAVVTHHQHSTRTCF